MLREAFGRRVEVHGIAVDIYIGFALDFYSKGMAGCTRRWFAQGMDLFDDDMVSHMAACVPAVVADLFVNPRQRRRAQGAAVFCVGGMQKLCVNCLVPSL